MADTPIDDTVTATAGDTDDLDAFENLLHGKTPEVVEEKEENVDPVDDSDASDPEAPATDDEPESTDEEEADVEDEDEDEPEPVKSKKPTARDRINELTAEKYAEKRRADELEKRLAALEAAQKKEEPAPVVAAPAETGGPDPDDVDEKGELKYPLGEFDPKFIADLTKYTIKQETEAAKKAAEAEAAARREEEAKNTLVTKWEEKLAKSEEGIEDLRPTIATLENEFEDVDPSYGRYLAETIMQMDNGPEVLYYLANNIDEARKIVAASPVAATIALGKIEAKIEAAINKKATPPVRTKAPTPPVSNRGNSGRLTVKPDTDDLEAFESLLYQKK